MTTESKKASHINVFTRKQKGDSKMNQQKHDTTRGILWTKSKFYAQCECACQKHEQIVAL